jgi:lipid-A-disaccharide synthase-like uncharacterized protein
MLAARLQNSEEPLSASINSGDPWIIAGLSAQFVIAVCILVQWICTARQQRAELPVKVCYAAVLAMLVMVGYAIVRGDIVFIVAQSLGLIIALRLLASAREARRRSAAAQTTIPRVSPETAERKYSDTGSRTGYSTRPS